MNKTQKEAWFGISGSLLYLFFNIYFGIQIGVYRKLPEDSFSKFFWLPAFLLISGISIYFIRKKQNPKEPDVDERDNFIKQRAVLAAFASVWIVLITVSVIPRYVFGSDGSVPVLLLPIIVAFIFMIVLLIYSIAVLVQYKLEGKGEES